MHLQSVDGGYSPVVLFLSDLEFHVVHAVARRIGFLIGGYRHPHLSAAQAAPVLEFHLPKLAGWWRFGDRGSQCPE